MSDNESLQSEKARSPIRLSILDTALVGTGTTTHDSLTATIRLAQRAEELGFTRYWMAEHHGAPGVASSAPVVTVGALAAATSRIRVGSGGVMLPNHVPLVVAEQFGTLAAFYPNRIDLGVGRATPEPRTAMVLNRMLSRYGADEFPQQVEELAGFLAGSFPSNHPYHDVFVSPRAEEPPVIWMLGASVHSADIAASLGLPFAFAHHFGRGNAVSAFEHYRRSFQPSVTLSKPYTMITALVVCAPTDEEADRIGRASDLMFLRLFQGRPGMLPSPEETEAHRWTHEELAFVQQRRRGQAIGSPATVHSVLKELLETTEADEFMMTTQMYRLADRIRSIEMVKAMFNPDYIV
ncbi:LLM class flavin-dependent oxidoreductase [Cohnella sp. GbtcB17]|uniref:LLM class flavin-dependent oxidoreductase n=1 Tax=Cohnella sp. GbtcB17 TaxID=2824762 RepID=UPI001C3096D6|nr:LLM class flavin-dependent oxidoreductase [Cohnella sp. GbtcB17]